MLVSRENLSFIHLISSEFTVDFYIPQALHEIVEILFAGLTRRKFGEPLTKGCIERGALFAGHRPCLFDEGLIGAQSDVLHPEMCTRK